MLLNATGSKLSWTISPLRIKTLRIYDYNHTVGFDGEHSGNITGRGDWQGEYETFYIWTQRVNLTSAMEERMADAMAKGRAMVVIDPVAELSREELASLQDYIRRGGSVLLMVSSEGPWSEVIRSFGLQTYYLQEPANSTANVSMTDQAFAWKDGLPIKPWGLAIKGGWPLLDIDGRVVLAQADCGHGKFLLFTDSQVFKDGLFARPGFMGYPKVDPSMVDKGSYDLQALYNLEYRIFEEYLGFDRKLSRM